MATVRFFVDEQGLLPEVCIKTGRSTSGLVTLRATYRPVWPVLFLPLSMLSSILGFVAGARHVSVTLPMSNEAVSRSRSWWRWSFALSAAGCCGLLLAA